MKTKNAVLAVVLAFSCIGFAMAAPEPTPAVTKGQIVGELIAKEGGKITVKGDAGPLSLMPHWRGGMPDKGGGFDKDIMRQLEKFKVGDKVKVTWSFEEHYRIDKIERSEPAQ